MAEFKIKDKETGEIFTVREKDDTQSSNAQQQSPEPQGEQPTETKRPSMGAKILRSLTAGSPIEQMKTSMHMLDKTPEVKQGEGFFEYMKRYDKAKEPREQEILGRGALAQLETPMSGLLIASGAKNPIQTLKFVAKAFALDTGASMVGINEAIKSIPQPELRDAAEASKVFAIGGVAGKSWGIKKASDSLSKLGGRLINSIIKPRHAQYAFGKNPGQAVAKEGIVATSIGDLATKIKQRLDIKNQETKILISDPKYSNVRINGSRAYANLKLVSKKLNRLGKKTHAAEITKLGKNITDIESFAQGRNLKELTIADAYALKKSLSSMQNWKSESESSKIVNGAVRKSYHEINMAINNAIPKLKGLNNTVANLISADKAIQNRLEVLSNSEATPTNILSTLDLPFKVFKSVLGKTLTSKVLNTKQKPQMTAAELLKSLVEQR